MVIDFSSDIWRISVKTDPALNLELQFGLCSKKTFDHNLAISASISTPMDDISNVQLGKCRDKHSKVALVKNVIVIHRLSQPTRRGTRLQSQFRIARISEGQGWVNSIFEQQQREQKQFGEVAIKSNRHLANKESLSLKYTYFSTSKHYLSTFHGEVTDDK